MSVSNVIARVCAVPNVPGRVTACDATEGLPSGIGTTHSVLRWPLVALVEPGASSRWVPAGLGATLPCPS